MPDDLKEKVYSNLDDALQNEYDVRDWEVDDIVTDLLLYADDLSGYSGEDLKPYVISWLVVSRRLQ
jgi:hypothetical protein